MIRIVFMGTPVFSVPVLEGLLNDSNYEVVGVVSQPDKKVGRHQVLTPSPVSQVAISNGIKLLRIEKVRSEYQEILDLDPDMIVTCAYGQIIPKEVLDYPKYGCINVHASLLPKLRGGAPIHKAIIDGYSKTGITIMYMDEGMDTGDIISQEEIEILDSDTVSILHDKLSVLGRDLLLKTLPSIISGNVKRIKQNSDEVTFAYNIKREDEHIDFNDTKRNVFNLVRGLNSFPGAFAILDKKIVKIYSGRCGDSTKGDCGQIINIYDDGIGVRVNDGEYIITELKEEGKKKVAVKDYLNGKKKEDLLGKFFE